MLSATPPGATTVVPPASVPLTFFAASGVGLVGFGLGVALAADTLVRTPTSSGAVGAVHIGVLAFLTVAVLGALHQFGPVVGRHELRSVSVARLTAVLMVLAAWMLPSGFAHGPENLVVAGGLTGLVAVCLAAWNLSAPLSSREGGVPLIGLRIALAYLLVTVCFGVVYALDRQTGWFPLFPHRVMAHAHLGLIGWLGITYLAVAEKLWPMFLLAHRPRARSGAVAVAAAGLGAPVLTLGLLVASRPVSVVGALLVVVGFGAHLVSLVGTIRHRRRPLELLHAYVIASALFLVAAVVMGAIAGLADVPTTMRIRLVSAEVAGLIAWVSLAVVGHVHKIVPFIVYTALRASGVRTNAAGGPLLFVDLYRPWGAKAAFATCAGGFAVAIAGVLSATSALVVIGGISWAVGGAITTWNLASGPIRVRRAAQPVGAEARPTIPVTVQGAS